jgi:hypothetical protein
MEHKLILDSDVKVKSQVKDRKGFACLEVCYVGIVDTSVKTEFDLFRIQGITQKE